ncbi:MAG: hypothetical protein H7144_10920 [Burkholderiales bacterium]|nr:hypothetical protein [Phycisphaerae bacterium]
MRIKSVLTAVVASLATFYPDSAARADLKIDLRFADGSKTLNVDPGNLTPINIYAWGIVSGQSGNAKEEGLLSAVVALQSQINSAGISGSITAGVRGTGWGGVGSQSGKASNLSTDGIGDWGSKENSGAGLPAAWFRARTTKSVNNPVDWADGNSPDDSVSNSLSDGGAEFLLGRFVFTPTAMPNGASLKYNPVTPAGGAISPGIWWEDTDNKNVASPTGGKSAGTGSYGPARKAGMSSEAMAVLPEPTSLGIAAVAGIGLLRRRRRV